MDIIELENNIKITESEELASSLDLYEHERAFIVEQNGVEKGSITEWEDGTIDYFDYSTNQENRIAEIEDVADIL